MNKVCDICHSALNIQVEYNLKDYDIIFKEGCLHCNVIFKSKLIATKQDINFHIKQLLNDNICGICNKNVIVDDVKSCKLGLTIFIYVRCVHCEAHYIIIKPCNSEEELNKCLEIGDYNIKNIDIIIGEGIIN